MAPKATRVPVQRVDAPRRSSNKGYVSSAYSALTSPENASVVRSVAVFGAAVAFFSSSWSEFLLPPECYDTIRYDSIRHAEMLQLANA
ncbi:hypothetical protein B0J14DRAFT_647345 [Halenospora varia]|nr:hypothetical protein B0J14DRAFT_647345 [Halenospora varia]